MHQQDARGGPRYAMAHNPSFLEMLHRRNAAHNAAYLLPALKPGMTVIDLGCGPGTISTGLAEAIFPGTLHCIDVAWEHLAQAEQTARERGVFNILFRQGDATDLPYADNTFDAAHCHALLMHVPDVPAALAEAKRVLKPSGIMSSRDLNTRTCFIHPVERASAADPHPMGIWDMLGDIIDRSGGNSMMGRQLKTELLLAGFQEVQTGDYDDYFDAPDEVDFMFRFLTEWWLSGEMQAQAQRLRIAPAKHFPRWKEQVARWAMQPGAVGSFDFGHAIGRKP